MTSVATTDAAGVETRVMTSPDHQVTEIAFSPDGLQVAFHDASPGTGGLFVGDVGGRSAPLRVTTDPDDNAPAWLDGEHIAYLHPEEGIPFGRVRVVAAAGGEPRTPPRLPGVLLGAGACAPDPPARDPRACGRSVSSRRRWRDASARSPCAAPRRGCTGTSRDDRLSVGALRDLVLRSGRPEGGSPGGDGLARGLSLASRRRRCHPARRPGTRHRGVPALAGDSSIARRGDSCETACSTAYGGRRRAMRSRSPRSTASSTRRRSTADDSAARRGDGVLEGQRVQLGEGRTVERALPRAHPERRAAPRERRDALGRRRPPAADGQQVIEGARETNGIHRTAHGSNERAALLASSDAAKTVTVAADARFVRGRALGLSRARPGIGEVRSWVDCMRCRTARRRSRARSRAARADETTPPSRRSWWCGAPTSLGAAGEVIPLPPPSERRSLVLGRGEGSDGKARAGAPRPAAPGRDGRDAPALASNHLSRSQLVAVSHSGRRGRPSRTWESARSSSRARASQRVPRATRRPSSRSVASSCCSARITPGLPTAARDGRRADVRVRARGRVRPGGRVGRGMAPARRDRARGGPA